MTFSATISNPPVPGPHALPGAAHTQVLAAALVHLLGRDGDQPARWSHPGFDLVVGACRRALGNATTVRELPAPVPNAAAVLTFEAAVARLARDPGDVALAIRRLELARGRALPEWADLAHRGLPHTPSDLDASIWFG